VLKTSGEFAVQLMQMIDTYSLTSARQLVAGQQKTIVGPGIGQFSTYYSRRVSYRPLSHGQPGQQLKKSLVILTVFRKTFNTSILLVGCQEEHPACEN